VQVDRDLKSNKPKDGDIENNLIPAADDKGKEISEAYFIVAKMFEYLHVERGLAADDLYYFLQHPREKKVDRVAKEIKKYYKQHQDAVGMKEQKQQINTVFNDLTKWVGSYREFVDFIEETHVLKELVSKALDQHKDSKSGKKKDQVPRDT